MAKAPRARTKREQPATAMSEVVEPAHSGVSGTGAPAAEIALKDMAPATVRPGLLDPLVQARRFVHRVRGPRAGPLAYLFALGPGLIAANAGNDAGGIATYSSVGASYGYGLLWMMVVITVSLGVVQEMCARMGAATGKGLSALMRENFGVRLVTFAMLALFIANGGTAISEFAG